MFLCTSHEHMNIKIKNSILPIVFKKKNPIYNHSKKKNKEENLYAKNYKKSKKSMKKDERNQKII